MAQDIRFSTGVDNTNLFTGLQQATAGIKDFGKGIEGNFKSLTGSISAINAPIAAITAGIAALTGAFAGILHAVNATAEWTMEVNKLSKTLTTNLETALEWDIALKTLGINVDDFNGVLSKVESKLVKSPELFDKWGISIKNANGGLLPTEEILLNINDKYQSLGTQQEKNAMLNELAGKGWQQLLPAMRLTRAEMERSKQTIADFNLEMSPEKVAETRKYKESINLVGIGMERMGESISGQVMPWLTKFYETFKEFLVFIMPTWDAFTEVLGVTIDALVIAFSAIWDAVKIVYQGFQQFFMLSESKDVNILVVVLKVISSLMVGIGIAIKETIVVIKTLTLLLVNGLAGAWEVVKAAWNGGDIKGAAMKTWNDIKKVSEDGLNELVAVATEGKAKLDKIWAPDPKKKEEAEKAKPAKAAPHIMTSAELSKLFNKELEDTRIHNAQLAGANEELYQLEKKDALAFWQEKADKYANNAEAMKLIDKQLHAARKAMYMEDIDEQKKKMEASLALANNDYGKQREAVDKYYTYLFEQYGWSEKLYDEYIAKMATIDNKELEEKKKIGEIKQTMEIKSAENLYTLSVNHIKQQEALGKISAEEALRQIDALNELKYQKELKALRERLKIRALDPVEAAKIQAEIKALEEKHEIEMDTIHSREAMKQLGFWGGLKAGFSKYAKDFKSIGEQMMDVAKQIGKTLEDSLGKAMADMILSGKSFGNAMKDIWKSVSSMIVGELTKIAAKYMVNWAIEKAMSLWKLASGKQEAAGATATATASTAAAATTATAGATAATAMVSAALAETAASLTAGAAGAWEAYGWIPYVGAGLAIAQIAEMQASVATASMFADGGLINKPTLALMGEAGPEFVMPTHSAKDYMTQVYSDIKRTESAQNSYASGSNANGTSFHAGAGSGHTVDLRGAVIAGESVESARVIGNLVKGHLDNYYKRKG